jgi:hypothetical protein
VLSSGTDENLTIDAKAAGTIRLGGTSTGAITLTRATTISAALTYGGVTLSNAVTGTGGMVLSASPTFTGTISSGNINSTGVITSTLSVNSTHRGFNITNSSNGSGAYAIFDFGNDISSTDGEMLLTSSTNANYGGVRSLNFITGSGPIAFHPAAVTNVLKIASNLVTATQPIAATSAAFSGTVTFGAGTFTALTEDTGPDPVADFLMTYDASATAFKKVKPSNLSVGFSAHKNTTGQTGITSGTDTKITFPTEAFDVGSYYDAPNSKWTPPAGLVSVSAGMVISGTFTTSGHILKVFKNGAVLRQVFTEAATADFGMNISIVDQANGTDFYEIYVFLAIASGTATVSGVVASTWFMGKML